MGLTDVLCSDEAPCASWPSILEPQGQAEHREEALGVEEESDPADPPV
jgi:hypothetical protein